MSVAEADIRSLRSSAHLRRRAYRAYRDTGDSTLPRIPEHWNARRLRFLLSEPLKYGANEPAESSDPTQPRYIRITDIRDDGSLDDSTFRSLPEETARPYMLQDGDVLFARSGATVGKTFLYEPNWGRAAFAGYLIRARLRMSLLLPRFLSYFTRSSNYWNWLAASFIQATIQNVSAEKYANLVVPLPAIDEQKSIAAFLDRETARIDALIAKKQRLIELLQEKRRAVVDDVLISKRHTTWRTERLRFSSTFVTSGSRGWAEFYSDDGPVFIRIGNLTRDSIDLDLSDIQRVTPPAGTEGERTRARAGDVLVSVTAYIGSVAVVPPGLEEAYVNQHTALVRLKPNTLNPRLLAYSLSSKFGQEQFRASLYGGTKDGLSLVDVRNILIIKPPRDEQDAIVATLDATLRKLTNVAMTIHAAIDKLREYRSALISAAVTGRIDVQHASKESEEAPPCCLT